MSQRSRCGIAGVAATPRRCPAASTPRRGSRPSTKSAAGIAATRNSGTPRPAMCRNSSAFWPRSARTTAKARNGAPTCCRTRARSTRSLLTPRAGSARAYPPRPLAGSGGPMGAARVPARDSPCPHLPACGRMRGERRLELSLDSRPIYYRPYLLDLFSPKIIEYILGEGNSFPVYMEAKELSLRRTVEAQPARYIRRIGNQQLNIEMKVPNLIKVSLQHRAITRYPDPLSVVAHFVMNELLQFRPVLLVQAGDVVPVDVGEIGFHHCDFDPGSGRLR